MSDRRNDEIHDSPGRDWSTTDDRVAAAEDRAAAAEHRADVAERRIDDGDLHDRREVIGTKPTYGFGSLLALLAALAIAVSAFLAWAGDDAFDETASANDFPIQFLWDPVPAQEQPSLLFLLLPAAVLVLLGTFIPRLRVLSVVGGAVALATAVLFFITVSRLISDENLDTGAFEAVGAGWWFAAIGGLVAVLGSLLIPRRDVVR